MKRSQELGTAILDMADPDFAKSKMLVESVGGHVGDMSITFDNEDIDISEDILNGLRYLQNEYNYGILRRGKTTYLADKYRLTKALDEDDVGSMPIENVLVVWCSDDKLGKIVLDYSNMPIQFIQNNLFTLELEDILMISRILTTQFR